MSYILLDGRRYKVRGQLLRQPQTPWLARISQSEPRYSDLQPASHWVMTNWAGGFGKRDGDIFEDTTRFYDSTLWTHFGNQLMLPAKVRTIPGIYNFRPGNSRVTYKGVVYQGAYATASGVRPLWKLQNGPTWVEVTDAGAPAAGQAVTDLAVHKGYLFVARGASGFFLRYDGTTWTAPSTITAWTLTNFRDDLLIATFRDNATSQIVVRWSNDAGNTFTELLRFYSKQNARKVTTGVDARGNNVILIGTIEGLWSVDYAAARATLVYDMTSHIGDANCRDMIGAPYYYVPTDPAGLLELLPGQPKVNVGYDRDDGLASGRLAPINTLWRTSNWLYAGTAAKKEDGTAWGTDTVTGIYVMNPETRTWHHIAKSVTGEDIFSIIFTNAADGIDRLYWWGSAYGSTSATPYYIEMPDVAANPSLIPGSVITESTGSLITPWFNGGFFSLPKVLLSFGGLVEKLAGDSVNVIQVSYATDYSNSWSTPVVFSTGPRLSTHLYTAGAAPTERLGVDFQTVRFKIDLFNTRTVPTVQDGPVVKHLVADYLALPTPLYFWRLRIYLEDQEPGIGLEELYNALLTAQSTTQAVAFYEDADQRSARHFVRISSVVFNEFHHEAGRDSAIVDIVVSEVAA